MGAKLSPAACAVFSETKASTRQNRSVFAHGFYQIFALFRFYID
jgi:hypothetical protein